MDFFTFLSGNNSSYCSTERREDCFSSLSSSLLFFLSTYFLGAHCLLLAPFVLGVLFFYSYSKRFTSFSHIILGLSLALAPGGAWWVLRPAVELEPIVLMLAVLLWVGGFDILYSCQDEAFDKENKLFSIPQKLGVKNALRVALALHIVSYLLFFYFGNLLYLGPIYNWGLLVLGVLFLGQHFLISADDLSRINKAFFTCNGLLSICYFFLVLIS